MEERDGDGEGEEEEEEEGGESDGRTTAEELVQQYMERVSTYIHLASCCNHTDSNTQALLNFP